MTVSFTVDEKRVRGLGARRFTAGQDPALRRRPSPVNWVRAVAAAPGLPRRCRSPPDRAAPSRCWARVAGFAGIPSRPRPVCRRTAAPRPATGAQGSTSRAVPSRQAVLQRHCLLELGTRLRPVAGGLGDASSTTCCASSITSGAGTPPQPVRKSRCLAQGVAERPPRLARLPARRATHARRRARSATWP